MPGTDFAESLRIVLGELPDLPHLPELPARGPGAGLTGRTLALTTEVGADLQPAGWRLTDAPGVDQRRARSLLGQDLDVVEEMCQGFTGTFKVQVCGPWTLAATVERPRGDRVLADRGARRDLAQALAEGVAAHLADVRRRLPGAELVVQVDEPGLPAVLAGAVPTASGFQRHRSVEAPEASAALEWVFASASKVGATSVAHCCARDTPVELLAGAGAEGISVDLEALADDAHGAVGAVLERGGSAYLGVVPTAAPTATDAAAVTDAALTDQVLAFLDRLGLDPGEHGDRLVITPTCGLAGAAPAWARRALELCSTVAGHI
jgi:hypothetical protein